MNDTATAIAVIEPPQKRAEKALALVDTKKKLVRLAKESATLVTAEGKDNYDAVHAARMKLKNTRVAIQKTGKSAREDATAFSKAVIRVEDDLIALISPEEQRLQKLQDEVDAKIEAEKAAAAEAERIRVAAIEGDIRSMRDAPLFVAGGTAEAIRTQLSWLREQDDETFEGDYLEQARSAKRQATAQLESMLAQAIAAEEAQAQQAARDAEFKARQDKLDQEEREARERREAEDRVAKAKRDEEDRVANEERARIAAEERAKQDARQAELDAQEAALKAERAEADRLAEEARVAAQIEQERVAAEQAEAQRVAQETALQAEIDGVELEVAIGAALGVLKNNNGPQSKVYRMLASAATRHFNKEF